MTSDITVTPQQYMEQIAAIMARYSVEIPEGPGRAQTPPPSSPGAYRTDHSLPQLSAPLGPLSLDTLMTAIGHEARKNAVRASADSIKTMGDEQQRVGKEQLAQLKEHMEKIEKQKHMSFWERAFSVFTAVLGAIASAVTIAAGVLSCNPLLVAGGVMGALMTVNSVMEMASGGKIGLGAAVTALAKACGASDEAAQWIGFGVQMALVVASAAISVGGALKGAEAMKKAAEMGMKVNDILGKSLKISMGTEIASSALGAGSGTVGIFSSLNAYGANENMVNHRKLEAAMEHIREAIRTEHDFLEAQVKLADKLIGDVADIVRGCNQTQQAIMRANPALA